MQILNAKTNTRCEDQGLPCSGSFSAGKGWQSKQSITHNNENFSTWTEWWNRTMSGGPRTAQKWERLFTFPHGGYPVISLSDEELAESWPWQRKVLGWKPRSERTFWCHAQNFCMIFEWTPTLVLVFHVTVCVSHVNKSTNNIPDSLPTSVLVIKMKAG